MNTWSSRTNALIFIALFGACTPFFMAGILHNQYLYKSTPSLEKHKINKPVLEINDTTARYPDQAIVSIIRSDYQQEMSVTGDKYDARPRYALLLDNIRSNNAVKINFIKGNISLWDSIVLVTAICMLQWVTAAWIYHFTRDVWVSWKIIQINIALACIGLLQLLSTVFYPFTCLVFIFYYVLPVPVLIMWSLYGFKYIKNILCNSQEPIITNIMYTFVHYLGFLCTYNLILSTNVPWLLWTKL